MEGLMDAGGTGRVGLARLAGASVAAGFGMAMGEDAYRAARRWWRPLVAAAALAGTAWAAFDLVRGNRRSTARHALVTVGLNGALVATSAAIVGWLAPTVAAEVEVGLAVAGALTGAVVRPARLRAFAVLDHNERFLREAGFVALGGRHGTVRDGAGRELVPNDRRRDAILFDVVDDPGRRTRIHLDERGRMTGYDDGTPRAREPRDPLGPPAPLAPRLTLGAPP